MYVANVVNVCSIAGEGLLGKDTQTNKTNNNNNNDNNNNDNNNNNKA